MSPPKISVNGERILFLCPGCEDVHQIHVGVSGWEWNRSLDEPTFSPSVLVTGVQWKPGEFFHRKKHSVEPGGRVVCHSFVRNGQIEFLSDSTHSFAGQTVELPDFDWPET